MQKGINNTGRQSPGRILRKTTLVCAFSLLLVACGGGQESDQQAGSQTVVLPVSLNEVMVSLINQAADPLWAATWNSPQTERDWRALEHLAYQLQIGGTLLRYPGTGPLDVAWTSNEQWQQYSDQLSQDGARAVNAVRSRNRDLMDRAGGQLIETCEACHRAFKPDLPTMDMFGDLPTRPAVSL